MHDSHAMPHLMCTYTNTVTHRTEKLSESECSDLVSLPHSATTFLGSIVNSSYAVLIHEAVLLFCVFTAKNAQNYCSIIANTLSSHIPMMPQTLVNVSLLPLRNTPAAPVEPLYSCVWRVQSCKTEHCSFLNTCFNQIKHIHICLQSIVRQKQKRKAHCVFLQSWRETLQRFKQLRFSRGDGLCLCHH